MFIWKRNSIVDLTGWDKETECHGDFGRVGLMCVLRKSTATADRLRW
jgi:hypothetical protein